MAFAKNLMGLGFSAAQASGDFISVVNAAVAAAGTTQATATLIQADCNAITTCAAGAGVILYNGVIGDSCLIYNDATGNALTIYPPTSAKINGLATNGGMLLANNTSVILAKVTATRWIGILSA